MDLAHLYKKHAQDKQDFNALRDKTWQELKEKHNQLIAAFGTKDNIPENYAKVMDKEIDDYRKDWAIPNGEKFKAMEERYKSHYQQTSKDITPANDSDKTQRSYFEKSLASTKIKQLSAQRQKQPDKFKDLDHNKNEMGLDREM